MNTKRLLFIICFVFVALPFFFSCEKDDDDNKPPTIEILPIDSLSTILSIKDEDTLYIFKNQDTIFNRIRAKFTDDKGLSSYNFRIKALRADATDIVTDTVTSDSIRIKNRVGIDSTTYAYWVKNYQTHQLYREKEAIVTQSIRIDSVMSIKNVINKRYPVWLDGAYQLKLSVVDLQGNEAIEYFKIYIQKGVYKPTNKK